MTGGLTEFLRLSVGNFGLSPTAVSFWKGKTYKLPVGNFISVSLVRFRLRSVFRFCSSVDNDLRGWLSPPGIHLQRTVELTLASMRQKRIRVARWSKRVVEALVQSVPSVGSNELQDGNITTVRGRFVSEASNTGYSAALSV